MTMDPEAKEFIAQTVQLIASVASLQATAVAQHGEQMRENNRIANELQRLNTLGEERERKASERETALTAMMTSLGHWQLTHPTDIGAHPDLRELGTGNALQLESLRSQVAGNTQSINAINEDRKIDAARAKARSEFAGVQYKGLTIGMTVVGSGTAIVTGILALAGKL